MKVVIAGGSGFIGSHIVEFWSGNEAEVHVIDNLRSGDLENISGIPGVIFHEGSITDRDLVFSVCKDADYIFDLAALVSVPESMEKPFETIEINTFGLLNLLDAAREYSAQKVVLSSSAAVYGNNPVSPQHTEMKPMPLSPYGITKLSGEYYCAMYSKEYGVNTVSLRYFNVYGPRQNPDSQYAAAIPIFIKRALNNEDITIHGDGGQTRDFIYVKDVVRANVLAATGNNLTGTYNVANGKSVSIKELAQQIIDLTGSSSQLIHGPERIGDIRFSVADVDNTLKTFGFVPEFSLENGLKKTIEYFKQENEF